MNRSHYWLPLCLTKGTRGMHPLLEFEVLKFEISYFDGVRVSIFYYPGERA